MDGTVRLWDLATGAERACLPAQGGDDSGPLTCCTVTADGSTIVAGTYRATVSLSNNATERRIGSLGEPDFDDIVQDCALSPDASILVTCGFENTLKLWDVRTKELRATLVGHRGRVFDCDVSPDGSYIVSASMDGTLMLWDPSTGEHTATLESHACAVTACAVGPDGWSIVSGGDDGVIKLWDVHAVLRGEGIALHGHTGAINDCAFSPDGSFAVSASTDRTLRTREIGSGRKQLTLTGHADQVNACAVSPNSAFVVSASSDGRSASGMSAREVRGSASERPRSYFIPTGSIRTSTRKGGRSARRPSRFVRRPARTLRAGIPDPCCAAQSQRTVHMSRREARTALSGYGAWSRETSG